MNHTKRSTTDKKTKATDTEVRKSKFRLYWEDRERRGVEGTIVNMRAVLK